MEIDVSNIAIVDNVEFSVEKGKPLPAYPRRRYPFDRMEVGDSFWVPVGDNSERTKSNLNGSARAFGRRKGQKFSIRRDEDGFRVWRIA